MNDIDININLTKHDIMISL